MDRWLAQHTAAQTEWSSNRAFRLRHKDVANVRVLSTHWSAERSPLKTPPALIASINYVYSMSKTSLQANNARAVAEYNCSA